MPWSESIYVSKTQEFDSLPKMFEKLKSITEHLEERGFKLETTIFDKAYKEVTLVYKLEYVAEVSVVFDIDVTQDKKVFEITLKAEVTGLDNIDLVKKIQLLL